MALKKTNPATKKAGVNYVPSTTMKPIKDRVLIFPDAAEEKSEGGIIIDAVKQKPVTGTIVATGPGTKEDPMELKRGDKVKFSAFSGEPIKDGAIEFLLMRETEILVTY